MSFIVDGIRRGLGFAPPAAPKEEEQQPTPSAMTHAQHLKKLNFRKKQAEKNLADVNTKLKSSDVPMSEKRRLLEQQVELERELKQIDIKIRSVRQQERVVEQVEDAHTEAQLLAAASKTASSGVKQLEKIDIHKARDNLDDAVSDLKAIQADVLYRPFDPAQEEEDEEEINRRMAALIDMPDVPSSSGGGTKVPDYSSPAGGTKVSDSSYRGGTKVSNSSYGGEGGATKSSLNSNH